MKLQKCACSFYSLWLDLGTYKIEKILLSRLDSPRTTLSYCAIANQTKNKGSNIKKGHHTSTTHVCRERCWRRGHRASRHYRGRVVMGQLLLLVRSCHIRPATVSTAASVKINKTQTRTIKGRKQIQSRGMHKMLERVHTLCNILHRRQGKNTWIDQQHWLT